MSYEAFRLLPSSDAFLLAEAIQEERHDRFEAEARLFAQMTNLAIATNGGKKTVKPSDFYGKKGASSEGALDQMAELALREARKASEKSESKKAESEEKEESP